MNANIRQYLFAAVFIGVGVYNIAVGEYLESSLYIMAGASFALNQMVNEPRLVRHKKQLVIATWTFIILTAVLFLYLLQSRYF
jgi:hypothetical protein